MKIKETAKNNIQITMNKQQAAALLSLLNNLSMDDYLRITEDDEDASHICDIWDELCSSDHLL